MTPRVWFASVLSLVIALPMVLAWLTANDPAGAADPGNLDVVAIDLDATGNQPQTLGTTEGCRDGLSDGATFDIDVVVRGINAADGVSGIGANITYDPAVLQINARGAAAVHMFMQAAPLGTYFDAFSDALPDTDGDYRHDAAEIGGTAESGDGVLMRLTVEIVGAGNTVLDLTDNIESDGNPNVLAFNGNPIIPLQVGDAQIYADGSSTCGAATPLPTPGPTVSPDPTAAPTATPGPQPTPVPGELPGFSACASASPVSTAPNAVSEIQGVFGAGLGEDCIKGAPYPSGDDEISYLHDEVIRLTPAEWVTADSDDIPLGETIGAYSSVWQFGLLNNPCNTIVPLNFDLLNASVDPGDTISPKPPLPGGQGAPNPLEPLGKDVNPANGVPDGAEHWPTFLSVYADRADVPWDVSRIRARYFGINTTAISGTTLVANYLVFEPGSPMSGSFNLDPAMGYPSIGILNDPTATTTDSDPFSDVCAPHTSASTFFGEVAGVDFRKNPGQGSYGFTTVVTNRPDADNDGIENTLDTCALTPNPTWNPRGPQPGPGDADGDGLPSDALGCDPNPAQKSTGTGGTGISFTDEDGDQWMNRSDNCPLVFNEDQSDADRDAIGDVCDPAPGVRNGAIVIECEITQVQIGAGGPPTVDPSQLQPCDPDAPLSAKSYFHSLNPCRLLDTRTGNGAPVGKLGATSTLTLQVSGRCGVPAVPDVSALVLNVTVTGPTAPSYLTVYPNGIPRPSASNLNYVPGDTRPNAVTVSIGDAGKIKLFNFSGQTHVIVDIAGYYGPKSAGGTRFNPLEPLRIMDTRNGTGNVLGKIGPGETLNFQVTGKGGVPLSGVDSVVMNVTVTEPTVPSYLTLYPADAFRPNASNLNYVAGQTVPNLVTVKLSPTGNVKIYNNSGATHLVMDVAGWYGATGHLFNPLPPGRILDTRTGAGGYLGKIGPSGEVNLKVANAAGVPALGAVAVVANATVTEPTASGYVTVYPADEFRPVASNLNFAAGQTIPNLVTVKLSATGRIKIGKYTLTARITMTPCSGDERSRYA